MTGAGSPTRWALVALGAVTLALSGLAGGGPAAVAVGTALCALGVLWGDRSVRPAAFTAAVGSVVLLLSWISPIDSPTQLTAGAVLLTMGAGRLLHSTVLARRSVRL